MKCVCLRYKEECHTIASQSETRINELKQKIENLRSRNEKLQSDVADVKRKEAEVCVFVKEIVVVLAIHFRFFSYQMDRVFAKNANRIKTLEERLHDAEEQAIQASRRVEKTKNREFKFVYLFNLGC